MVVVGRSQVAILLAALGVSLLSSSCGRIGYAPVGGGQPGLDAAADSPRDVASERGPGADIFGGTDVPVMDSGTTDAGEADGGVPDSGGMDAGPVTCPPASDCTAQTFAEAEYCICEETELWSDAQTLCQSVGLDLVRVDTNEQNDFLVVAFSSRSFWLGGSDGPGGIEFRWPDGTVFWTGGPTGSAAPGTYTKWGAGQPRLTENADCVNVVLSEWYAGPCTILRKFACGR